MGVNKGVFGSHAEKENFYKLSRVWGANYRLYHNLPFLHVLNPSKLMDVSSMPWKQLTLSKIDLQRLKKTSIDYVLCDVEDRPLLGIEFDGMQDGFNVGTTYFQLECRRDEWRDLIMKLKLNVAHGSLFPYFIFSSEHFRDITPNAKLTIVDGVIGNVMSNLAQSRKFAEGFRPEECGLTQKEFDSIDRWEQDEVVQDWALGVQVECEVENNPLSQIRFELLEQLNIKRFSVENIIFPEIPENATGHERAKRIQTRIYEGTKCILHTNDYGDVESTVTIPNFQAPGYSGFGITEDIAFILSAEKLKNLRI